MNEALANLPAVLKVFALLFSNQWISRWQKKWQTQKRLEQGPVPQGRNARRLAAREQQKQQKKKPPAQGGFYQRIYSARVTLWYLIYQRLNFDQTQAAVVVNLRGGGADRLGKRGRPKLSDRVHSAKTSAYNEARQRLPLELLQAALGHLRGSLLKLVGLAAAPATAPGPAQRTRQLLDGSTLALLVTPALAQTYPPGSNQSGASDWSLMRIVVGFCARSGAVLSALEGAMQCSEQAMAWTLIAAGAKFMVWIGDRNFGVWSVVAQAVRYHQDVLVRLTKARALKLIHGRPMQSGEERLVQWCPSSRDKTPPGTERKPVSGRLIYVRLQKNGKCIDLWLFTTLDAKDYSVELLVSWYGQRWQAELHFRSVKTQMKMVELDVCTPAMARKEFYTGLLAYNLVRTVMWAAGERLAGGIKVISFSQARRVLLERLKNWGRDTLDQDEWTQELLEEVAQQTLPKRAKERPSEIRRQRSRSLKYPPLKGSRAAARAKDQSIKSG